MFLYDLVVLLYGFVIRIASVNNAKAKLWVKGRKNWRITLANECSKLNNERRIWVHCASLGEFEQGRPLLEAIKQKHPTSQIILTFFSPSGFEGCKNYKQANVIAYLPLDTKKNATDFLSIVKPDLAIFIKYEFWINFLNALKTNNTPSYLVSAVFKDHHPFFKWYGGIFRRSLQAFKILMVQDENSKKLLQAIKVTNVSICGDTRFDRVLEIKEKFSSIPEIEMFKGNNKLLIGGSTWPLDDDLIIEAFKKLENSNLKLLIAPHEINNASVKALTQKLNKYDLSYSIFSEGLDVNCKVLILNTMGMLARSYHYADSVYIGGGFNSGIHNILEPAVYLIPVAFYGNEFNKYNEAVALVNLKAVCCVMSSEELQLHWQKVLNNTSEKQHIQQVLEAYFEQNTNVTSKVMSIIDFG